MKRRANAKINICLKIKGLMQDGYHDLDMIFTELDFGDEITIEKAADGIHLSCNGLDIEQNENLAYKAAAAFFDKYKIKKCIKINIEKKIPQMAGLGGGSSDAACVLKMLCEIFNVNPYDEKGEFKKEFKGMASSLGSDVPFFLNGGTQRALGKGDLLTILPPFPKCHILLLKPSVGVSTPKAYKEYDMLLKNSPKAFKSCFVKDVADAIERGDLKYICENLYNDLEPAIIKEIPLIASLKAELLSNGAMGALMSGSGSAVFGIFESKEMADLARSAILSKYDVFSVVTRIAAHQ